MKATKQFKRGLCMVLAGGLILGCLAGCGDGQEPEEPVNTAKGLTATPKPQETPNPERQVAYTKRIGQSNGGLRIEEYDASGLLIKQTVYDRFGKIKSQGESEYDASGQIIKSTSYNADGSINNWCEYEYNASGQMIRDTEYHADGSIYRYE